MATASALLGTTTAFTITQASAGNQTAREATAVASGGFLDVQISGQSTVGAATATGDSYVLLGGYDGKSYPSAGAAVLTGVDAAVTLNPNTWPALPMLQYGQPVPGTGLTFGAKVAMAGLATTVVTAINPFGFSQAFNLGGLTIPNSKFTIVVVNWQGQANDATAGHFAWYYTSVQQTIA